MNIKDWPCWGKIGVAVSLTVFVFNWPDSSGEWAAWIQAFGSIGAIVGAIWVFSKQASLAATRESSQRDHRENELRRERTQRLLAVQRLATLGAKGLASFSEDTSKEEIENVHQLAAAFNTHRKSFELGKEILKNIDLSIYPNVFLGIFVVNLRHQANRIDQAIERVNVANTADDVMEIKKVLLGVLVEVHDLSKKMASFAREYDGSTELSGAFTLD